MAEELPVIVGNRGDNKVRLPPKTTRKVAVGHSNGTTVNMLPLDDLQKPKFALPPKGLVERLGRLFAPTQQRIKRIHNECMSLAALRDTLLLKLIAGDLRVPDAERIVGRCM